MSWLPDGFELISGDRHRLLMTERTVESRMYSDGLFSFSVYVSDIDNDFIYAHAHTCECPPSPLTEGLQAAMEVDPELVV